MRPLRSLILCLLCCTLPGCASARRIVEWTGVGLAVVGGCAAVAGIGYAAGCSRGTADCSGSGSRQWTTTDAAITGGLVGGGLATALVGFIVMWSANRVPP